jgi:long-chain acyl-CoA synthetase
MAFFQQLEAATETQRATLLQTDIINRALSANVTLENYQTFLLQAYHHVKHTVPLLMAAGSRLPDNQLWLQKALAEYIEEEIGHDEWILNDLVATGIDRETARNSQPHAATELMVAYAYHTIDRTNPLGFFGMVHVLEGTSIAAATKSADGIQQSLSLPDTAFSYLRSHGDLDIEHVKFFEGLMDKVTKQDDQDCIIHRTKMFYRLYADVFNSITEE